MREVKRLRSLAPDDERQPSRSIEEEEKRAVKSIEKNDVPHSKQELQTVSLSHKTWLLNWLKMKLTRNRTTQSKARTKAIHSWDLENTPARLFERFRDWILLVPRCNDFLTGTRSHILA